MRSIKENKTLVSNATTTTNGEVMVVSTCDEVSIQIITNSTDFEVSFEVSLNNSDWSPIEGYSMDSQADWKTKTIVPNTFYTFDISTCEFFRARVSKITNGSVKIIATSYNL